MNIKIINIYNSNLENINTVLTFSNGVSSKLIDTDGIYNIRHIGDTLYYIKNSSVYKYK